MKKPTVKYDNFEFFEIQEGKSAIIKPVDHPSNLVTNTTLTKNQQGDCL